MGKVWEFMSSSRATWALSIFFAVCLGDSLSQGEWAWAVIEAGVIVYLSFSLWRCGIGSYTSHRA